MANYSSRVLSEKLPTPQFVEMLRGQTGKRAVYRGTGVLAPVTIAEVRCGIAFEATLVPVAGIVLRGSKAPPELPEALNVGAAWGLLDADPHRWLVAMSGCCWRVQLSEAACDAVVRLYNERSDAAPEVLFRLADRVSMATTGG
jgi:hypothetical protein